VGRSTDCFGNYPNHDLDESVNPIASML
jgi:hypothetical protein